MTTPYHVLSRSPADTIRLARRLARHCRRGDIICLFGDLGSGKTTFTRGMASGLKIAQDEISSPTFTLMNVYEGRLPLYHFDLYRLDDMNELFNIGYEEFLFGDGVAVVEWAQKLGALLPDRYLEVRLRNKKENERAVTVKAHGGRYEELIGKVR